MFSYRVQKFNGWTQNVSNIFELDKDFKFYFRGFNVFAKLTRKDVSDSTRANWAFRTTKKLPF